ncbi:ATP-binding protein [Amycolatopsis sp. FDAARGOS 1241]|uniref:ATP-binding protein n=1 Tax=Amycolatopsis sp. FDAARGOS 1241 TaxID=2778070 RepID=UPI0019505DB8|nr:ATP-binding protein [Amycolatopsis sp. FDAARGOS 1241]QRP42812.1 ATP-binding protein [Amycolatopsis sp. FDAARGOS 1241]
MCSASNPDGDPPALHLRRPARLDDASLLRYVLTDWARGRGLPDELIGDLELAVYEALVNAAEHAYPEGTTGTLDLHAHHDERTVQVTVTDHGRWRPHAAPDPRRGRGLPLIQLLSDHAEVTPTGQGTVITMAWQLTRDRSSS